MMWDRVIARVRAICQADPALLAIFGAANMRYAGVTEHRIPSLEWSLIADSETENWAPCIVQFDIWADDTDLATRAERRLRRLFHVELPVDLAGLTCWSQFTDAEVLALSDRSRYIGRAVRFTITPLRDRYAPPEPT